MDTVYGFLTSVSAGATCTNIPGMLDGSIMSFTAFGFCAATTVCIFVIGLKEGNK